MIENWYDPNPAVRTAATYNPPDAPRDLSYSRPTTDIVDYWCPAAGVAPYTQTQVHHNGTGGINFVNVDGVLACQINCTLTVTLTVSTVVDGRGRITATPVAPVGNVLFSINGFQTPGLPPDAGSASHIFDNLPPGTYTVSVRETRTAGCAASATAKLVAVYAPRFTVTFPALDKAPCLLKISERGYTGAVEELTAQPGAVVLDWPGGATDHVFTSLLRGSQCQIALYLMYDLQLQGLYSGDERLHLVEFFRFGAPVWSGYLLPEQYDVAFLAPPATFNLSATDGIGTLGSIPFLGSAGEALRGDWTMLRIIQQCLGKLGLNMPLNVLLNLYPSTATLGTPAIEQITFDVGAYTDAKNKTLDCAAVLRNILTAFQARLYQQGGAWWLERLSDLSTDLMDYASYASDGTRLPDVIRTSLVSVQTAAQGVPYWQDGGQRQQLRAAVAKVTLAATPGDPQNLLAFATPKYTDLPGVVPSAWTKYSTAITPFCGLIGVGQDKEPLLRLVGAKGATSLDTAPYVQTPATPAVPIGSNLSLGFGGDPAGGFVLLSFTAKPYGNTPSTDYTQQSRMGIAVKIGSTWVNAAGAESVTPLFDSLYFPDGNALVRTTVLGFPLRAALAQRQPILVRLCAPVGGPTPCTVDITKISLQWLNGTTVYPIALGPPPDPTALLDSYTTSYTATTGQLVSRVDTSETLLVSDTAQARHVGTPLDALGRPVQGWQEPVAPGQYRELGDYAVRDRVQNQYVPAQAITGTLRGWLPAGPGQLITDPAEINPAIYVLVGATHQAADASWAITAVQINSLQAPTVTLPANAIYNEDGTAWQDEAGNILVYES